ncbi:helix-turn-helix domain-containing protein [Sediminibacter sp. Hel_I_10]|uniref:helix-turn-helix domain-containing protein n=1 Tax=Sediminibacter sp. Hel_I_10 TaxID=1392490 RepID=UPI00047AD60C|nr:helix-turn-helix domain-containing protein [Sediminibacter sp. Hel_I_10]
MPTSIITTDDLREFKMELLDDIKKLLAQQASGTIKKYLKSSEVMDMLQVSPGTLQNLRINGTLPYTKVGGIIYYDTQEIQNVMEANRVQHVQNP